MADRLAFPSPDGDGGARYRSNAEYSWLVIGFYLGLVLILILISRYSSIATYPLAPFVLAVIILVFLARYLSTRYALDADHLDAWRLFGSRRLRLEAVRKIEFANLRDLGPVSFFGSWGWRGRMWSPIIGRFDSIHTASQGLLVTAGPIPLFISPKVPGEFARELSRRVRSYTGPLEVDVGAPG